MIHDLNRIGNRCCRIEEDEELQLLCVETGWDWLSYINPNL